MVKSPDAQERAPAAVRAAAAGAGAASQALDIGVGGQDGASERPSGTTRGGAGESSPARGLERQAPAGHQHWWGRLRACLPDLAVALLMLWSAVPNRPAPLPLLSPGMGDALYLSLLGACCAAIAVRRLAALASVLVIGACMVLHLAAFQDISLLAVVSCLVAVETTQSRLDPPWRWVLLGAAALGVTGASLRAVSLFGDDADRIPFLLVPMWMALALAAFVGGWRRRRRDRFEQALERAAVLEAQQETERRLAVAQERQRIAREVHDLLGHSLSVIAMQAEGARAVLAADPLAADRALTVIGQTSRSSVDEVRALVDMLRTDEAPHSPARRAAPGPPAGAASQEGLLSGPGRGPGGSPDDASDGQAGGGPGTDVVGGLAGLVGRARQAGAVVSMSADLAREVEAGTGTVLHRVAQESLTNALRHAPGAACSVRLAVSWDRAELVVSNGPAISAADSAGATDSAASAASTAGGSAGPAGATDSAGASRELGGFGLTSMRERMEALGGSLRAGPQPGGGWRVAARLPLPAAPAVPAVPGSAEPAASGAPAPVPPGTTGGASRGSGGSGGCRADSRAGTGADGGGGPAPSAPGSGAPGGLDSAAAPGVGA